MQTCRTADAPHGSRELSSIDSKHTKSWKIFGMSAIGLKILEKHAVDSELGKYIRRPLMALKKWSIA
jgi:hypothetical protein